MIHRTRATAALILAEILAGKGSLSAALDPHRERSDYQLLQEMCFGCCRWFHQLDFLLEQLLSKPFKKKDQDLRSLLVLGLYQLKFMRIPDHAAINETVSATGFQASNHNEAFAPASVEPPPVRSGRHATIGDLEHLHG